jgi:hypothetical protein
MSEALALVTNSLDGIGRMPGEKKGAVLLFKGN